MLHSLRKAQQSLEAYSRQAAPQIDKKKNKKNKAESTKVLPILRDPSFWQDVATAARILGPIHEIQYLSEADNYSLHRVINNWMLIKQSLLKSTTEHGTEHCHLSHIVKILWDDRYLKQITTLHVVASLLNPENHVVKSIGQTPEAAFGPIITAFF